MNTEILENKLQNFSDTSSEINDVVTGIEINSGLSLNIAAIQCRRLIAEINRDFSGVDRGICGVEEKIEQLKAHEGIL